MHKTISKGKFNFHGTLLVISSGVLSAQVLPTCRRPDGCLDTGHQGACEARTTEGTVGRHDRLVAVRYHRPHCMKYETRCQVLLDETTFSLCCSHPTQPRSTCLVSTVQPHRSIEVQHPANPAQACGVRITDHASHHSTPAAYLASGCTVGIGQQCHPGASPSALRSRRSSDGPRHQATDDTYHTSTLAGSRCPT